MVTVSKKQVHMLLTVLPCSAAVCIALPVQLERVGGEGFKLSHVMFQHSCMNKLLVGLGKKTMPLVEICRQRTLRQCHWEGCDHLELHRVWAGLCMWCKAVPELLGWLAAI